MLIMYYAMKGVLAHTGNVNIINAYSNYAVCNSPLVFRREYIWIICQNGIDRTEAHLVEQAAIESLCYKTNLDTCLENPRKVDCIRSFLTLEDEVFNRFSKSNNNNERFHALGSLEYVESQDVFTFARNLGVHDFFIGSDEIARVAGIFDLQPRLMVEKLSQISGDSIATVELVMNEAVRLGFLNLALNYAKQEDPFLQINNLKGRDLDITELTITAGG